MPNLRAQVVLPGVSGKPEDVFVNTFHFNSASSGDGAATVIAAHLTELYNVGGLGPSGNSAAGIAAYLSHVIDRGTNKVRVKVYDLADALPRVPIEKFFTLAASIGSTTTRELPAEVACVGSIYAGVNRPRYRGRLFFGPFHESAIEDAPTLQRSRPALGLRESIVVALKRLANKAANTQNLAVYSEVDNVARLVTAGWVDDAWDIQRRRGQDAEGRLSWSTP